MLTKLNPVAVAVNTNINRVCAGTGIDKPVNIPLEIDPIDSIPVNEGVRVINVPGIAVIVLLGTVD